MRRSGLEATLSICFLLNTLIASSAFALENTNVEAPETNIISKERDISQSNPNNEQQVQKAPAIEHPVSVAQPTVTQGTERVKNILVPPNSVMYITLQQPLHSKQNQVGENVQATVIEPVYVGPYLAVPSGSTIIGQVTHVNDKKDKEGRHPYIVVQFKGLKRANEPNLTPMHASLIAYKNGIRGHEYVWKLPDPKERKRENIKSAVKGALSGIFLNPLFGPPLGAGAAILRNSVTDKFARGGNVEIKANEPLPIAIDEGFTVSVSETVPAEIPVNSDDQPLQEKPAIDKSSLVPLDDKIK
jgi:hypothetical protein